MPDLRERDLFYDSWKAALGPETTTDPTMQWLTVFGSQTKWLPEDVWSWYMEQRCPVDNVDPDLATPFLALVTGLIRRESPHGEAVRYANDLAEYVSSANGGR